MAEHFEDDLRQRLILLERNLADVTVAGPGRIAGRPRPRLTRLVWIAAIALLVAGFAGGAAAREFVPTRELVPNPEWIDSGLFTQGGALYCSGIQGMVPSKAAPLLSSLGYHVTWQVDDKAAHTTSQTIVPPAQGLIIEGIQNGRQLVVVVDQNGEGPIPHSCPN